MKKKTNLEFHCSSYYHRWINHSNSLKFEKAFKEQCELRIQEKIMNKGGGTLVDWEFLTEAADLLTKY